MCKYISWISQVPTTVLIFFCSTTTLRNPGLQNHHLTSDLTLLKRNGSSTKCSMEATPSSVGADNSTTSTCNLNQASMCACCVLSYIDLWNVLLFPRDVYNVHASTCACIWKLYTISSLLPTRWSHAQCVYTIPPLTPHGSTTFHISSLH